MGGGSLSSFNDAGLGVDEVEVEGGGGVVVTCPVAAPQAAAAACAQLAGVMVFQGPVCWLAGSVVATKGQKHDESRVNPRPACIRLAEQGESCLNTCLGLEAEDG